ncbi:MAG: sigma-70 family RNA polymerase sigma factor [Clostridia bacterium]|nr:sigma-70 family RNA polymerase sigma factor [Clostridia bacterium]
MNNEEIVILVKRVKNGDDAAFETLVRQYGPLIHSIAISFDYSAKSSGFGNIYADLSQELSIALFKAAGSFDTDQSKVTFGNYAKTCLRNCAVSYLRKLKSAKRRDSRAKNSIKKDRKSYSAFSDNMREDVSSVLELASSVLSAYEYGVFTKYLSGMSVAEIADSVNRSPKSVSNAVFRCKAKIKSRRDDN